MPNQRSGSEAGNRECSGPFFSRFRSCGKEGGGQRENGEGTEHSCQRCVACHREIGSSKHGAEAEDGRRGLVAVKETDGDKEKVVPPPSMLTPFHNMDMTSRLQDSGSFGQSCICPRAEVVEDK